MATTLTRRGLAGADRSHADPVLHIDWAMLASVAVLITLGLVGIYTATYTNRSIQGLDTLYYLRRQGLAIGSGLVVMAVLMAVDYRRLRNWALLAFAGTTVALAALPVVARARNGTEAWFDVGPVQVQPSEFAKVTLILVLAAYLASDRFSAVPFTKFVGGLALLSIPAGLVLLQPDLGTASVLVVITMGVLLVAGANPRHIALVTLMAAITAGAMVATGALDKYQQDRLTAFLEQNPTQQNRDLILQVRNSKAAIAGGGLSGKGWLEGPLTNGGYVPEQHTDFVFSAVGEQFGFIGSALLLLAYAFLALRIWRTARLAQDGFGTLICAGALAMLAWHVFENVGMTMGITPVTGIPLPLVSYGGSSMVAMLALVGLVESVHMRRYT